MTSHRAGTAAGSPSRILALALGLLLLPVSALSAQAGRVQRTKEYQVMRTVAAFLEQGHVSGQVLDDRISRMAFDTYLDTLDPLKLYFDGNDVRSFAELRDQIDDLMRVGDARFANMVFNRLRERIDERVGIAEELLAEEPDFDLRESFAVDADAIERPADDAAARERWRKRIKYDLLGLIADGVAMDEARERLSARYSGYRERMGQSDRNDVLAAFVNSVTTSFDPHTAYLSPKGFEDLEMQLTLNYQGIGALLQERDGYALVEDVLPGGAAEKDGKLQAGDRIVAVGQGDDGELVDVVGMRLTDVVKLIRGEEGSLVRLGVLPAGGGPRVTYELVRQRTELPDSAATGDVIEARTEDGSLLRVGIIELPSFYVDDDGAREGRVDYKSSTRDTRRILEGFESEAVDVVVLDLRNNGGGPLAEAVGVTGLFIDRGPVVQIKQMDGSVRVHYDRDGGMAWNGPLVVLTSRVSASASEIVSGAIADYQRGLLVGDTSTHGKGTVQTVVGLGREEFGALKLTVQQFYRPDGLSTQRRGVPTDVRIPSLIEGMAEGEASLPNALPFNSIDPVEHALYGMVNPAMKEMLQSGSASRCAESEVFAAIVADLALYKELNDRARVSLRMEDYLQLEEKLEASRQRRRELSRLISQGTTERDHYLDEVIEIAEDYLALLRG